eukprot:TRINITY_DN5252_c0_g1_i2.p1 TRINITY_DN5252_c0_g1~~TRINITY_DN5252_c0_g1_i2.p1  ORF type:complete len:473 (+),score=131.18 TRINITY_DN5252_c0_g1_i2:107-1420(+)
MVALIVILAIAIPIYVGTRPDPTKISNLNPRQRIIRAINESDSNTVPVVQWDPDLPFAQTAAKIRHPIVLRNTYATKWKAMKKWSPKYLQERMKDDSCTVFYSNDPIFIYHETEGTLKFEGGAPYHRTSMTISQFFNKLQDSNDPAYYYLIHPTTSPSISADFNTTLMELPSQDKSESNIWIGEKGVTAQTHFDAQHNFYVQIKGRKKWTLFPPSSWKGLYLYPFLHQGDRQSQVPIEGNPEKFPRYSEVQDKKIELILEEGDMLYLPPFWFHRVETLDHVTVSINTWTNAEEYYILTRAFSSHIPLDESWDQEDNAIAMTLFLKFILKGVLDNPAKFVRELIENRYTPIYGRNFDGIPLALNTCTNPEERNAAENVLKEPIWPFVENLLEPFRTFKLKYPDTFEICLMNYVETIARVIGAENSHAFLSLCLEPAIQ